MTPEELEYANKQADYMHDLMLSGRSKDDALRAAWDERDALQQRAEAAEAALQAVMTRAAQLEAERDAFAAENEAIHRAVNELCGTDTSTIEAVQHVIDERDYQIRRAESLQATLNTINNDNDELRRQLEQAQREITKLEAER